MRCEYPIRFEEFDKSKIKGTYTRLHYGTVKVGKLAFKFCVYEIFLSHCNHLSLSLNFIDAAPGNHEDVSRCVIEEAKDRLKPKTK